MGAKERLLLHRAGPKDGIGWSGHLDESSFVDGSPFATIQWAHWKRMTGDEAPVEVALENLS
ncbi:MAG TPA: hypothetical protein VNO21_09575 [Polyangiaceae bacterium]|nr:hypothetical protein [Polyangiaceae bacterium]